MSTFKLGLATVSLSPSPSERIMEGDITSFRRPNKMVGRKQKNNRLWFDFTDLRDDVNYTEIYSAVGPRVGGSIEFKRRYCIPFDILKTYFDFDLVRARNPLDDYQPFYLIDDIGWADGKPAPISILGIVFDKKMGMYV